MILLALACALVALTALGLVLHSTWEFRRQLARIDAAAAAEAPCEALSHVRLIPQDLAVPEPELAPEDDLFVRMVDALNRFAEENGYTLPVPTVWMAIASVVANAILGEDLAAVLWGVPGGDAS